MPLGTESSASPGSLIVLAFKSPIECLSAAFLDPVWRLGTLCRGQVLHLGWPLQYRQVRQPVEGETPEPKQSSNPTPESSSTAAEGSWLPSNRSPTVRGVPTQPEHKFVRWGWAKAC